MKQLLDDAEEYVDPKTPKSRDEGILIADINFTVIDLSSQPKAYRV